MTPEEPDIGRSRTTKTGSGKRRSETGNDQTHVQCHSGLLIDSGFDIAYSPWKHFGFGGGLRYFDLRLEAEKNRLDGEIDFDYWGPTLFVVASF
jgi:hypothetical protein